MFDSTGLAIQDLAIALAALDGADALTCRGLEPRSWLPRASPPGKPVGLHDEPEQLELGERRRDDARGEARRRTSSSTATGASATTARDGLEPRLERRRGCTGAGSTPTTASTSSTHGDRRRAEPQQRVRAAREQRRDLAGHGEHLAALVEREVGGDQRAAPLARLDDDGRVAEPGDDPVARREPPRRRLDARRDTRRRSGRARRSPPRAPRARAGSRGRCRSRARRPSCPPRARRGARRRRRRARGPTRRRRPPPRGSRAERRSRPPMP